MDIGTKGESSLPSLVELSNHHNITNFLFVSISSFTVSYHRFPEKQADGCNLCRSTVFLSDPSATKVKVWLGIKRRGVVVYLRRVDAKKTDSLFLTTWTRTNKAPKVPEEAHQEKPDGISCLLLSNYRRCVK